MPGFNAAKIFLFSFTCAASEINNTTKSDSEIILYISPRVPDSLVNPASSAAGIELEFSRNPTFTVISVPSNESLKFCA